MNLNIVWQQVTSAIRAMVRNERGASLVEYALLVALIAVVCIIAITFLGTNASKAFSNVGNSLANP
jgi:pilus assembly protein Flp/PilA